VVPPQRFLRDRSDITPTERPAIVPVDVLTEGQSWRFDYPKHGVSVSGRSPEIVLPAGTGIRFTLRSADVIHAFWIPQLAGKQVIVPGRTKAFVLHTGAAATYTGLDAEYAGIEYDLPDFEVRIVTFDEFRKWAAEMGLAQPFHDAW
jgi:cytochrome c oxidase subunit 2